MGSENGWIAIPVEHLDEKKGKERKGKERKMRTEIPAPRFPTNRLTVAAINILPKTPK